MAPLPRNPAEIAQGLHQHMAMFRDKFVEGHRHCEWAWDIQRRIVHVVCECGWRGEVHPKESGGHDQIRNQMVDAYLGHLPPDPPPEVPKRQRKLKL